MSGVDPEQSGPKSHMSGEWESKKLSRVGAEQ